MTTQMQQVILDSFCSFVLICVILDWMLDLKKFSYGGTRGQLVKSE